jgi:oxygen-dependent protoporphyrinogen oxidase
MNERILVIGAGVSGLAAGHRLMKQGFDVTVLDKADYIGGKAKTSKRNDGYIIDEGASILPSKYVQTINLIKELGLEAELQPGGSIIGFARGDKIHYMDSARLIQDSITTPLISLRSKLLMVRIAIDNFRIKPKLSYEDISLAADFDFETAAQYTRRRGNEEIFEYIVDTTLRGLLGTSGEKQSVVDFFFSFNNVIGSKLLSFKQGMGFLPNAIAARSGLDVRLNCQVSEVRTAGKDVEVSWTDPDGANTERVAGVVVALPAFAASAVVPELPPQAHEILNSFKYTTSVNINLGLEKPPKNIPAVVIQVPKSVHPDLFAIVLDHNKAPGRVPEGKGMASLYTMSDWAEELIKEDDDTVLRKIIEAGERVVPGLAGGMEFSHINRWYPVIVYSAPGDYKKLIPLKQLLAQNPRIAFAGDYFSCSNLNTAIAGGERAARDICAQFGRN